MKFPASYLIPVLLLAFAACGPAEVTTSVTVNRPVSTVWNEFNDSTKLKLWLTGLQSIERIEGEDGQVGGKYRMLFQEDGNTFELIETVTEFQPEQALGFSVYHESMTTDLRFTFTPVDDGTRIDLSNTTAGNGVFWSLMVGLMGSKIKERHDQEFAAFKKMVETPPTP